MFLLRLFSLLCTGFQKCENGLKSAGPGEREASDGSSHCIHLSKPYLYLPLPLRRTSFADLSGHDRETAQQLKAPVVFAKDQVWVPRSLLVTHNYLEL